MASTNSVIFPESMADIVANPRWHLLWLHAGEIHRFSRLPRHTVTSNQQIRTDLLTKSHPPTPSNLIAGIDRFEDMLSDTIKVCECVKRPRRILSPSSMLLGLRNAAHVASRYMKRKIQIKSGPKTLYRGNRRSHVDEACLSTRIPKHGSTVPCPKKLRRPRTKAHRRQMNRESSQDRLAFQIARTTISLNYLGEELETLNREVFTTTYVAFCNISFTS
jgi:hypothetical protein